MHRRIVPGLERALFGWSLGLLLAPALRAAPAAGEKRPSLLQLKQIAIGSVMPQDVILFVQIPDFEAAKKAFRHTGLARALSVPSTARALEKEAEAWREAYEDRGGKRGFSEVLRTRRRTQLTLLAKLWERAEGEVALAVRPNKDGQVFIYLALSVADGPQQMALIEELRQYLRVQMEVDQQFRAEAIQHQGQDIICFSHRGLGVQESYTALHSVVLMGLGEGALFEPVACLQQAEGAASLERDPTYTRLRRNVGIFEGGAEAQLFVYLNPQALWTHQRELGGVALVRQLLGPWAGTLARCPRAAIGVHVDSNGQVRERMIFERVGLPQPAEATGITGKLAQLVEAEALAFWTENYSLKEFLETKGAGGATFFAHGSFHQQVKEHLGRIASACLRAEANNPTLNPLPEVLNREVQAIAAKFVGERSLALMARGRTEREQGVDVLLLSQVGGGRKGAEELLARIAAASGRKYRVRTFERERYEAKLFLAGDGKEGDESQLSGPVGFGLLPQGWPLAYVAGFEQESAVPPESTRRPLLPSGFALLSLGGRDYLVESHDPDVVRRAITRSPRSSLWLQERQLGNVTTAFHRDLLGAKMLTAHRGGGLLFCDAPRLRETLSYLICPRLRAAGKSRENWATIVQRWNALLPDYAEMFTHLGNTYVGWHLRGGHQIETEIETLSSTGLLPLGLLLATLGHEELGGAGAREMESEIRRRLRTLWVALVAYAVDRGGFPDKLASLVEYLPRGLTGPDLTVFNHPADPDRVKNEEDIDSPKCWLAYCARKLNAGLDSLGDLPLLYERRPTAPEGKYHYLRLDGKNLLLFEKEREDQAPPYASKAELEEHGIKLAGEAGG